MRKTLALIAVFLFLFIFPTPTLAVDPSLIGGAVLQDGVIRLYSDSSHPYSAASFYVPNSFLLQELKTLSLNYKTVSPGCSNVGSPTAHISLDTDNDGSSDASIYIYLGIAPDFYKNCQSDWGTIGNLITSPDARVAYQDGTVGFASDLTFSQALSYHPDAVVKSILVEANSNFGGSDQIIDLRNVVINADTYSYEPVATPTEVVLPTNTPEPTIVPTATPTNIPSLPPIPTDTLVPTSTTAPTATPTIACLKPTSKSLTLTPMCSLNPNSYRVWKITNNEAFPIPYVTNLLGTLQINYGVIKGKSEITFTTRTIRGPNATALLWHAYGTIKESITTKCK